MTLRLTHPTALEPGRAAAKARYRVATGGQKRKAWAALRDETTEALRRQVQKRGALL
jgi:hypothetical protein